MMVFARVGVSGPKEKKSETERYCPCEPVRKNAVKRIRPTRGKWAPLRSRGCGTSNLSPRGLRGVAYETDDTVARRRLLHIVSDDENRARGNLCEPS